jgi:hypothetical protein
VSLSIQHGNCAASAYGCAMLGMKIGPHFGDYHSGYLFGTVAVCHPYPLRRMGVIT